MSMKNVIGNLLRTVELPRMVIELVSFLHTADWQIGMKASRVADVAEDVRKARLDTARQLMRMASQREVDFVLIAGDLFENNLVHNEASHRVAEVLSTCSLYPFMCSRAITIP